MSVGEDHRRAERAGPQPQKAPPRPASAATAAASPLTTAATIMIRVVALLAVLARASANGSLCSGATFFGEDRNPDDTQNDVLPILNPVSANAARDTFFNAIMNPTTEDLEDQTVGVQVVPLVFPGSGVTATLAGGEIRKDPPVNGQYAISPVTYFSTEDDFNIDFSQPITAFGFFGVDVGDVQGILSITIVRPDETYCVVPIPHEVDGPSGGVLYFAYIDLDEPFNRIEFGNSEGQRDRFAFDDFTIAIRREVEDELCAVGITNADETVCCADSCGVCGGCDCDMNPGGAANCCPGVIAGTGIFCMAPYETACLLGEYIPVEDTECNIV
eukprot:scaffold482_cov247-Pinguiococcus_pyrenoidosus.AAC.32